MKKHLLLLFIALICGTNTAFSANNPALSAAIQKYKAKNYVGCIQDAQAITKKDPSNAVAYYYMAISYARIGNKEDAISAYEKVVNLSSNSTLVEYAQKGTLCLNNPEECKVQEKKIELTDIDKFIRSGASVSNEVKEELRRIQSEQLKNNINTDADQKSQMPTNDEIAEAVKTLAKAGVNPLQYQNNPYIQAQQAMYQNPEYMQLQMLMGNNNNNGNDFMSMLPLLMAQQSSDGTNRRISPDVVKSMMMSSMIGSLNTTFDTGNNL